MTDDLQHILDDDTMPVTREWLDKAMSEAPYSTLPMLIFLKRNGIAGNDRHHSYYNRNPARLAGFL